jgi:hypothetical protein
MACTLVRRMHIRLRAMDSIAPHCTMSTLNYQLSFATIGDFGLLSDDTTTRTAHIDIPAEHAHIAATLQSARTWLLEQHPGLDMESAADLPLRAYFTFHSSNGTEGFNVDSAQLVAIDEGFVLRAGLDNGMCVETDPLNF